MPSTSHAFDNRSISNAVARQQELSRDEMRPTNAAGTLRLVEEAKSCVASHRRVVRGASVMFVFRRIVVMLLIVVLASGALSSPVLRHTHAMSDHSDPQHEAKPHSHGHPHPHSHAHGHFHSHGHHDHDQPSDVSHDHGERAKSEPTLTESAVEHVHLVWLGFEMTLPVSPSDSSDRSDTGDEWIPLLGEMVQARVEAAVVGLPLADGHVQHMALAAVTPPRVVPSASPDDSRLCDTARRERSGVLRI
jgi:hypothetical protein